MLGVNEHMNLKLFGREIIFKEFHYLRYSCKQNLVKYLNI